MAKQIELNTEELQEILEIVNGLPISGGGGLDTSDATATADHLLAGVTAYAKGIKITGKIQTYDGAYVCSDEKTG